MIARSVAPGLYAREVTPPPPAELRTAVPAMVGLVRMAQDGRLSPAGLAPLAEGVWLALPAGAVAAGPPRVAPPLQRWREFVTAYPWAAQASFLAHAAHGFFANGGELCYVLPIVFAGGVSARDALAAGLELLAPLDAVDLVCAPDLARFDAVTLHRLQRALLDHCAACGDRVAILDAPGDASPDALLRHIEGLESANGAIYYPWVGVAEGDRVAYVPPCGHVAGVYARGDARAGVHKAPANEPLEGVLGLAQALDAARIGELNTQGVNCLRSFPARGVRVWGARTLSREPAWTYVNVRRLFLTAGRWVARSLVMATFEPNDPRLWARIGRELTAYCEGLYAAGALKGASAEEAYFVRCDLDTNPPEVRERGELIAELGLAPSVPNEFVVVRIVHTAGGATFAGAAGPA